MASEKNGGNKLRNRSLLTLNWKSKLFGFHGENFALLGGLKTPREKKSCYVISASLSGFVCLTQVLFQRGLVGMREKARIPKQGAVEASCGRECVKALEWIFKFKKVYPCSCRIFRMRHPVGKQTVTES